MRSYLPKKYLRLSHNSHAPARRSNARTLPFPPLSAQTTDIVQCWWASHEPVGHQDQALPAVCRTLSAMPPIKHHTTLSKVTQEPNHHDMSTSSPSRVLAVLVP